MNNPLDQIQSYYEDLTKTDKDIAVYIINNPDDVVTQSMDFLVEKTGSSKSALSRFAQRIGYSGYIEFKYELARFMVSYNGGDEEDKDHDPIRMITRTYSDYILKMAETLDPEQIKRIADMIVKANSVKIFGFNRSYNSCCQFKQRLSRIGISKVSSECDTVIITDLFAACHPDDVFVVFSTRDNTKFFSTSMKEYMDKSRNIIFITANPNLPFRKKISEYVVVPRISKDSYASFLDDQAIFFVLIEILMEAVVEKYKKN
ncbi:MAG: MurR/RpiR family transcriptional regulator [Erysipelotrichaceae bacterium]|nr:MurR/RpiR family transcriptional regulator [Erysipelotrichaceae bacterium]